MVCGSDTSWPMWLCVVLKRVSQSEGHGTNDISLASCVRSHEDAAFERMLARIEGRQAIPWQDSEKVEPKWNNVS